MNVQSKINKLRPNPRKAISEVYDERELLFKILDEMRKEIEKLEDRIISLETKARTYA